MVKENRIPINTLESMRAACGSRAPSSKAATTAPASAGSNKAGPVSPQRPPKTAPAKAA